MRVLIFIWVAVFVSLAFVSTDFITETPISFYNYYSFLLSEAFNNLVLILFLFVIGIAYLLLFKTKNNLIDSLVFQIQIIIISFFSSGLAIFFIAIVELNILSILLNVSPKTIGIKTDRDQILQELTASQVAPEIIPSDPGGYELLRKLGVASSGKSNYFGKYLLPSIPDPLLLKVANTASSMSLVDATLIISYIDKPDLQALSKVLAYKIIQDYFPDRSIKSNPNISIMGDSEYEKFRIGEIKKKSQNLMREITSLELKASESAIIQSSQKQELNKAKSDLDSTYKDRQTDHQQCLSAGKYIQGIYQKTNTETSCRERYDSWSAQVIEELNRIDQIENSIEFSGIQISQSHTLLTFLKAQHSVLNRLQNNIPDEYGAFQPENNIGVAFVPDSPHQLLDYLSTLTHEYLHFSSYIGDKQVLSDSFFEEGLTEYFTRQVIKRSLKITPNIGYPAITKIINQLSLRIPESELAEIYFTKNQSLLESVLNRVYGDNFYSQNRILFVTMQYTSNPSEIVRHANLIMEKIGGKPLTESDVISSSVSL